MPIDQVSGSTMAEASGQELPAWLNWHYHFAIQEFESGRALSRLESIKADTEQAA